MQHIDTKNKLQNTNWLNIRKTLNKTSDRDLIGLVGELYSLSPSNKHFLEARFLRTKKALDPYKALIKKHIAPDEPWKSNQPISIKDAKKVLSDYKKATSDSIGLLELMVYYVECGTDFICEFGDVFEQYYMSLESVFDNTLKIMKQLDDHEIQDFIDRLKVVIQKAEPVGWGYYDSTKEMLHLAYPKK